MLWNPDPILFELGPLAIRWYGLLFATGFLVGFAIMRWMYVQESKPVEDLDRLLVVMMVSTIVGARLGHCLFYDPAYYLSHPIEMIKVWKGGLASHGGAIGILTGLYIYARSRESQPYLWLLDRIVVPTALAGACIRLGNFFNSEIIGEPTDVPWAIIFARVDMLPRHPAQLYESLAYLMIFAVLLAIYRRLGASTSRGRLLGLFLVLVFSARFLIEFVKVPQAEYAASFALSVGQLLSIPAVLAGVILLLRSGRRLTNTDAADV